MPKLIGGTSATDEALTSQVDWPTTDARDNEIAFPRDLVRPSVTRTALAALRAVPLRTV